MKKRKVIRRKFLPTSLPFTATGFWSFMMYYFNAPSWAWGVYLTLMIILWIILLVGMATEDDVSISEMINMK